MSRWGSAAALGVAVLAQGLVLAGTAHAEEATVAVVDGQLTVRAADGQANQVTITQDGGYLTVADVVVIAAGPGCVAVTDTTVSCTARGVGALGVALADRADTLVYFGTLPMTVEGGDGDDHLSGGTGGDVLIGDIGADVLTGGAGNDVLYGDLSTEAPICDTVGCADELYGDDGADQLYGGDSGDRYWGGPGNDRLDDAPTGDGGGTFDGGTGDDIIDGSTDSMRDTIDYRARSASVLVDLVEGEGSIGNETDKLANIQDIQGGAADDMLIGNPGDNRIMGNGGHDRIVGGGGLDVCAGEEPTC